MLIYSIYTLLYGLLCGPPSELFRGLASIYTSSGVLISDFVAIGGLGPALVNSALVSLATLALFYYCGITPSGISYAVLSLMAGFSLFGKTLVTMFPIILGGILYSRLRGEKFCNHLNASLLAACLSPFVSFILSRLGYTATGIIAALAAGVIIGFLTPPLAAFTLRLHEGYNLYNVGFAAGLLALMAAPLLKSYGVEIPTESMWAYGENVRLCVYLLIPCLFFILISFLLGGKSVIAGFRSVLKLSGKLSTDVFARCGRRAAFLNMGINGIIATAYILAIGGQLNGPTAGGVLTVLFYGAFGKHARNTLPILAGIILGGLTKQWSLTDPGMQIAALFSTGLAPIAGEFGWLAGIAAGFVHSSAVQYAGMGYSGMNLYNNGFAGGLVAVFLLPLMISIRKIKKDYKDKRRNRNELINHALPSGSQGEPQDSQLSDAS